MNIEIPDYIEKYNEKEINAFLRKTFQTIGYRYIESIDGLMVLEKDFISYTIKYSYNFKSEDIINFYINKVDYDSDLSIILSNNIYSDEDIKLARKLNIVLWDRIILNQIITKSHWININENYIFENDPLYNDVINLVKINDKISTSILQRKYRIGYNRASNILDELKKRGLLKK